MIQIYQKEVDFIFILNRIKKTEIKYSSEKELFRC